MKPFLFGKKAAEAEPLRALHGHRPGAPTPGIFRPAPTGATVECVKQGDKVTRLVVTCACGERIEIDCLYPAGS